MRMNRLFTAEYVNPLLEELLLAHLASKLVARTVLNKMLRKADATLYSVKQVERASERTLSVV